MTSWLWLGLALLLVPAGSAGSPAGAARPREARRSLSLHSLQLVAASAVAAGSVVVLGGTAGLVVAPVAAAAAWYAVERLHGRPARIRADPSLPFALDLAAAALRAGQPLAAALVLAAPAAGDRCGSALARVGRLIALGADPGEAWEPLAADPLLGEVAAVARRSAASGIRLAAAFEATAEDLRSALRSAAQSRAQRAGAFATAPLGLCFLPAFVCLAIVPVVVGIAAGALGSAQ